MCEIIKTIYHKIQENKTQYDLDRQTTKISALSSQNVGSYNILTGDGFFYLEKGLLQKAVTIKIFEYSPLGSDLKNQTDKTRLTD